MGAVICSPGKGDDLSDDETDKNDQESKRKKPYQMETSDIDKIKEATDSYVETLCELHENDPSKAKCKYYDHRVKICDL